MSRYLLLFAFLVLLMACENASNAPVERVLYYKDSKIVLRRYTQVGGKIVGKMYEYYKDGRVKMERQFSNGVEEGVCRSYYPSGALREIQVYRSGVLERGDTLFYEDGRPQFAVGFLGGKKQGMMRKWGRDGSLIFEAVYRNDTLVQVNNLAGNRMAQ